MEPGWDRALLVDAIPRDVPDVTDPSASFASSSATNLN